MIVTMVDSHMKIALKTIISIPELPTEIEMGKGTVRDVFLRAFAAAHFASEIIDPKTGTLKPDDLWDVRVNDVPCISLSQDLDTPVHDGDTVSFSFLVLGGG
jgi:hypothetical protein